MKISEEPIHSDEWILFIFAAIAYIVAIAVL